MCILCNGKENKQRSLLKAFSYLLKKAIPQYRMLCLMVIADVNNKLCCQI